MSEVQLNEAFLAGIAGWEAMKRARALLETDKVLSSNWTPPILKGVVQEGTISYRAGLVIKSTTNVENMCGCRESRQWGTMCVHSVAVGLHHVRREKLASQPPAPAAPQSQAPSQPKATVPLPLQRTRGRCLRRAEVGTQGEPLQISVILPPNLTQAITKGSIMVCLEGEGRRGRMPLNSLDKNTPFTLSPNDLTLLNHLEEMAGGDTPGMIQLKADAFAGLLAILIDHPRITLGKSQSIAVSPQTWIPPLTASLQVNGEIVLALRAVGPAPTSSAILNGQKPWVFHAAILQPIGLPTRYQGVMAGPMRLTRAQIPLFMGQDWQALAQSGSVEANFKPGDFSFAPKAPRFVLTLQGGLSQLQALLQCSYGPRILPLGTANASESLWLPDPDQPTRYSTRDLAAEQAAMGRLMRAGFSGPDTQYRWQLNGQNAVLNFFAREFYRLQKEWEVTLEERLDQSIARNIERVEPTLEITPSGEQWFDLQVDYQTSSGERFSPTEIQRLLLSGQSHRRLNNGKFAVIDTGAVEELQEVLLDCAPRQHANGFRLANTQAGFLTATVRNQTGWQLKAPESWQRRFASTSAMETAECPPLGELETRLRPYQKTGVAWLNFLHRNGCGGILADDMGLGKTLQMLAFLQSYYQPTWDTRPSLVICPTSLVFNWVAEANKFTPALRVLALHGPDRAKNFKDIAQHDILITSYALIRRDAELYRGIEFAVAVLDEAQHIKNRQTQNAQAVKSIRADTRFVLTGTPMENSVLDLWSIFDFVMPGYLGQAKDFRERYELPVSREKNTAAQARLARRIRPFLLRRLKQEVARDLPAKIEQVSFCELTGQQAEVYRQVLEAGRREITESVGAQGLAKSRMLIFTTLLRLRQICCDLRLLKLENIDPQEASGKLDLFQELLEEVVDGGHRVLIFSQFTSLLSLIRETLAKEEITYCYLDGSTINRAEVVDRFQQDATIPVFLLSLKAGGTGLNLTGADTVIHLDPWWNPAVEDQATDRAHRIGQTRVVTSYKLITRGTVEEKILSLQQRKRDLLKGTLGDEESLSQVLTWDEIQELMA
ncbi:MAG: SNF2-related protein [Verrucomicrobiota bacterium]